MKKTIYASLFLLSILTTIISCKREFDFFDSEKSVSDFTLQDVKIFHAQNATLKNYPKLNPTVILKGNLDPDAKRVKSFIKLSPLWEKSKNLSRGKDNIIAVPTKENKLENTKLALNRFFIFKIKNGRVSEEFIVEVINETPNAEFDIEEVLGNYEKTSINGFNGGVIVYDANYYYVKSKFFKNGIEVDKVGKIKGMLANKNKPLTNGAATESTYEQQCTAYYLFTTYYYGNGTIAYEDMVYLYTTCTDVPTGCTVDCSTTNGGGGNYGGNESYSWSGVAVTVKQSARPCLDSIKNTLSIMSNLLVNLQQTFNGQTNTNTVPGMINRLASSTDWNVQIGEMTIPDVEDTNTGVISRTNARTNAIPGSVEINFNINYLNSATDLAVASTMIHELMHAYFVYGMNKTLDPGYDEFVVANNLLFKKEGVPANDPADSQHEMIANKYVDQLAGMLNYYAMAKGITSPNSALTRLEYCKDLAWGGLQDTKAYRKYAPNKSRIVSTQQAEYKKLPNSTNKKGC